MDEKVVKSLLKICVFIAIANLPFVTIIQVVDMNTFLDSFNFPESYQYFKSNKLENYNGYEDYIVLQKSSHPDFSIIKGDDIFYLKDEGGNVPKSLSHKQTGTDKKILYDQFWWRYQWKACV